MEPTSPPDAATGRWRLAGVTTAAVVLALAAGLPAYAAGPAAEQSPTPHPSDSQSAQSGHDDGATDGDTGQGTATASPNSTDSPATPASQSPTDSPTNGSSSHPGNNGHFFIHDTAKDPNQDPQQRNDPHVGCTFYVDFWGFDAGQKLMLKFVGQAPTGKGVDLDYNGGPVTIADDAQADGDYFDTEVAVTLDPSGLGDPHPKQGYHVKPTVTTGQPGDHGVKHKVFWMGPCSGAPTPGGTTQGGGTSPSTTPSGTSGTQVLGTTLHRDSPPDSPSDTQVLGTTLHRSAATSDSLPFTGAPLAVMVAAAVAALGGGIGLNVLGRWRRYRAAHR